MAWHDGYTANTAVLDSLTAAERIVAEQELIVGLQASNADPRAIIGLGHLRSRAALPVLHTFLVSAGAYALPAIARIDAQALDAAQLNELLQSNLSKFDLIGLLVGLRLGFTLAQLPRSVPATVLALLVHPDYLVRSHALQTLRVLYQLPTPSASSEEIRRVDAAFDLICSDRKVRHHQQAQRLIKAQIVAQGHSL